MPGETEAAVEDAPVVDTPEAPTDVPTDPDTEYQAQVDKIEAAMRASETEEGEPEAADEVESQEDGKSYLGEDALEQIVKFKHNGEERELSVKEMTALAQKGLLFNDKNQELADRAEDLEAREQQLGQPQVQQTQQPAQTTDLDRDVANGLLEFRNGKEFSADANAYIAEVAWANYSSQNALAAKVQELENQVSGINTSAERKTSDERLTEGFQRILAVDDSLGDENLFQLQTESENAGFPNVFEYYQSVNMEKVIASRIEQARAEDGKTEKNGREASVRPAISSARAKGNTKLDTSKMSEGEQRQAMVNILHDRGYR